MSVLVGRKAGLIPHQFSNNYLFNNESRSLSCRYLHCLLYPCLTNTTPTVF